MLLVWDVVGEGMGVVWGGVNSLLFISKRKPLARVQACLLYQAYLINLAPKLFFSAAATCGGAAYP